MLAEGAIADWSAIYRRTSVLPPVLLDTIL
jgi:hypothetical protein